MLVRFAELNISGCNPLPSLLLVQTRERPSISSTIGTKAERSQKYAVLPTGVTLNEYIVSKFPGVRDDAR